MIRDYEKKRILIWGKTYPELSMKYFETVCTAGVLENGRPVRLYPISFRYLNERFKLYQWITALIAKNDADGRPESYRIDCESIELHDEVPSTTDEWGKRAEIVFRDPEWQFENVEDLVQAQKARKSSIGVVAPKSIRSVDIAHRPHSDEISFKEKFEELRTVVAAKRQQLDMFERALPEEMKRLEFLKARIQITWDCHGSQCAGHRMQILDWGVCELQRKAGDDAALAKVRDICDLEKHALKFFLGNLHQFPTSFMIVGLWYPRRSNLLFV